MNLIRQMLFYSRYIHVLTLSLFFTILVAPNKQFFNREYLRRTSGQCLNHRKCKHLQFWSRNCFVLQLKHSYHRIVFLFYIQKVLC